MEGAIVVDNNNGTTSKIHRVPYENWHLRRGVVLVKVRHGCLARLYKAWYELAKN